MDNRNLLLLTATITPKSGVPNLKRTDPKQRLTDYIEALKFYLSHVNQSCDGIIFVENSNSDISQLQAIVHAADLTDQVEFIVFDGLDYPVQYDRGYGEFKLLNYGMTHSRLIQKSSNKKVVVWKITGRYIIQNIAHIIANQPKKFDLFCNCRNYPKYWVDTYVMAWTPTGYETCLRDVYHRLKTNVIGIPQGIAAEELLRSWLEQKFIRENAQLVRRFHIPPEVGGIRGADNKGYSTDNYWKYKIRYNISKVFPWIWV